MKLSRLQVFSVKLLLFFQFWKLNFRWFYAKKTYAENHFPEEIENIGNMQRILVKKD